MPKPEQYCLMIITIIVVLTFLFTASYGQGFQNGPWNCLCPEPGLLGTQVYTGNENLGFTECSCPINTFECQGCPQGQIVNPLWNCSKRCNCTSPLVVVVRLTQLQLSNYTPSLEKTFMNDFASYLHLSPSQMIPSGRRNGSVTLDIYIFSQKHDLEDLMAAKDLLLSRNNTYNGPVDLSIGPWSVLYLRGVPGVSSGKDLDRKMFLLLLLLCAVVAITLMMLSLLIFMHKKHKNSRQSTMVWFEDDSVSSNGFRALLTHHYPPAEKFHVYENKCFTGNAGCIGKGPFKSSIPAIGPILGVVARQFSYTELREATGGFSKSNVIGTGGSSTVYKGCLKDGRHIAIKKLNIKQGLGLDRDFLMEVELLSRLHHFHLVPLFGYCIEPHGSELERLLVYEFMANGNLREHLNQPLGRQKLNWTSRLRIALGAARGLEYLHEAANPRVLHRDFKSSNILLDALWRAKVADFGMAKAINEVDNNACPTSPAQMLGTFGYFAPEYAMMGRATVKSDVFSFGVVLLELISGRKPLEKSASLGHESLVVWALPLLRNTAKLVDQLVDPALKKQGLMVDDIQKMAHLAWLCLQMDPECRPTMTFVVQVLAALVPENSTQSNYYGPFMDSRDKVPQVFSWTQDQSFSRDTFPSPPVSPVKVDQTALEDRQSIENLQDIAHIRKGESASAKSLASTSLSATEYLERFTSMVSTDKMRKSTEEEADLVKPRLEYFWQNNGLLVQEQSLAR